MAKMVNNGPNPLILPNDAMKVVAVGEDVEVSKETAEIPSVAELIDTGALVAAKDKK